MLLIPLYLPFCYNYAAFITAVIVLYSTLLTPVSITEILIICLCTYYVAYDVDTEKEFHCTRKHVSVLLTIVLFVSLV